MKTTLATIILMLSALQAHADGFYQLVVGNAPEAVVTASSQNYSVSETPLYQQIMAQSRALAKHEIRTFTLAEISTDTPLYQVIHGS